MTHGGAEGRKEAQFSPYMDGSQWMALKAQIKK